MRWNGIVILPALAAIGLAACDDARPAPASPTSPALQKLTEVSEPPATKAEPAPIVATPPKPKHGTAGCGTPPPHSGNGKLFDEAMYIPTSYDPYRAHPLLVLAHHKWDDAADFMMASGFADLADLRHFVILAPNNGDNAWEQPARFLPAIEAIVDDVKKTLCVDPRRVYVVGQHRGGRAALAAACESWATAIAVNSSLPKEEEYRKRWWCDRPVPALWLSPTKSNMVRIDGTRGCVSPRIRLRDFEAAWRQRNDCEDSAVEHQVTGGVCRTWTCSTSFKSCELDGGHYWPGVPPQFNDEFNCQRYDLEEPEAPRFATAEQIWSFFESLPVEP